jgi:hypothetical protein
MNRDGCAKRLLSASPHIGGKAVAESDASLKRDTRQRVVAIR